MLIVDDNEINQKVISVFLRLGGHQTEAAYSGEAALEMAAANNYDAILMDVMLPGIDGREASRRIRQLSDPHKASVPILAVTGNISAEDVESCKAAGMDDFLGKPIAMEALEAALARLPARGTTGGMVTEIDSLDDYLPAAEAAVPLLSTETLDRLGRAFDHVALSQLLDDMLAESMPLITGIATAQQEGDRPAIRTHAHTLKGMAMTLGVIQVGDLAADIETAVQRHAPDEEMADMITRLQQTFAQSEQAIAQWRGQLVGQ